MPSLLTARFLYRQHQSITASLKANLNFYWAFRNLSRTPLSCIGLLGHIRWVSNKRRSSFLPGLQAMHTPCILEYSRSCSSSNIKDLPSRDLSPNDFPSTTTLRPVVLCGPSGAGKSTLIQMLQADEELREKFGFAVSHTTRPVRDREVHGLSYHFISQEEMWELIVDGHFLEHAKYANNIYGTSVSAVKDVMNSGKVCLLDLDPQGVRSIKALDKHGKGLNAYLIFIDIPDMKSLEDRLRARGTETEEKIQLRLSAGEEARRFGHSGIFHEVIVNRDLATAFTQLRAALIRANPCLTKQS